MYFLDTNIVIKIMLRQSETLVARFEHEIERGSPIFLSSIVFYELAYGVSKSVHPKRNFDRLSEFLIPIADIIAFDRDDALEAGDIRAELENQGLPIGPYDVQIAAQARRRKAVIVTNNRREFNRVPGLMVADWTE